MMFLYKVEFVSTDATVIMLIAAQSRRLAQNKAFNSIHSERLIGVIDTVHLTDSRCLMRTPGKVAAPAYLVDLIKFP